MSTKIHLGVCELPMKGGPCNAAIPRVYFDSSSGMCKDFSYGGCQGNGNNFITKKECEQTCGGISEYKILCE